MCFAPKSCFMCRCFWPCLWCSSIPQILYTLFFYLKCFMTYTAQQRYFSLNVALRKIWKTCPFFSLQTPSGYTTLLSYIMKCFIKAPQWGNVSCSFTRKLEQTYVNPHLFWYIHTEVLNLAKKNLQNQIQICQKKGKHSPKGPLMLPSGTKCIVHTHCNSSHHCSLIEAWKWSCFELQLQIIQSNSGD